MRFWTKKPLSMDQKVAQIIRDHDDQMNLISQESDDALDAFRKTVNQLEDINAKIDASVNLMDQQLAKLTSIKDSMTSKKAHNEKVKGKIQEFLA